MGRLYNQAGAVHDFKKALPVESHFVYQILWCKLPCSLDKTNKTLTSEILVLPQALSICGKADLRALF